MLRRRRISIFAAVCALFSALPITTAQAAASSGPPQHIDPTYTTPVAQPGSASTELHLHGKSVDSRLLPPGTHLKDSNLDTGPSNTSAPAAATAYSGPRGYVQGKSVKVAEQWDASHRVWLNPDGTYSMQVFSGPQNYRDASGTWQPIDGTIKTDPNGVMHPGGLPVGVQFAPTSAAADLVRVSDDSGDTVRFGAPDGASPAAKGAASGTQVQYSGIFEGVDLRYIPSTAGVKELIVLNSAAAAAAQPSFSFRMQLGRLHAQMRQDGGIDILDSSGTAHFTIPAPIMTDSNVDQKLGDGKHGPVAYALSNDGATTVLTVTPDAAWLADAARVYPVYVDPTFDTRPEGSNQRWDAYVASAYPDSFQGDYWDTAISPNRWVVNVGKDPSGASGVNRSYAYYALDPLFNNYTRIISANWNGYTPWTYYAPGSTSSNYVIEPPSSVWGGGSITWHTQPSCCESGFITISSPWQTWNWNVDITSWVVNWANGSQGHNGVEMASTNETNATLWRRIASVKNTDGSASYILVNYEQYGAGYSFSNSQADGSSNSYRGPLPSTGATLPVYVTNNGSDTWPAGTGGAYRLSYHVYNRSGGLITYDTGTRTYMPSDVAPGQGIWLTANIGGLNPGSYTLQWDMVEENVTWFSSYTVATAPFMIFVASPPTPQYPGNGTSLSSQSVTLSVGSVSGATQYRFELSTSSDFSSIVSGSGLISGTSWTIPAGVLQYGTTYYWHALAADSQSVSSRFSSTSSFTYQKAVPTTTKSADSTTYMRGGVVNYTVTMQNPTINAMTGVALQDTMDSTLLPSGTPISLVGATCGSGGVVCSVLAHGIQVSGLTIPAASGSTQGQVVVQYSAVALGLDRSCTLANNSAVASDAAGTSPAATSQVTICDAGLGNEAWWTYVDRPLGPHAVARVNVANGNLVEQHDDLSTFQLHGHLGLGLRRTYNSEDDTAATLRGVVLPGEIGAGWTLNVSEAGDLGDNGVGPDGLYVPSVESFSNPLAVTLIDQDGTRHVFQPRGLSTVVDVTALQGVTNADLSSLFPTVLSLTGTNNRLCADFTYTAPPGVHLSMWRYVETTSGSCGTLSASNATVLGYATERPDRLRSEYAADGHLLDVEDGIGNQLQYSYANNAVPGSPLGNLMRIGEPTNGAGRAFTFSYPSSTEVDVTDPADRTVHYYLDGSTLAAHLIEAKTVAADGSTVLEDWHYAYGGCASASADQLCSVTDPRGHQTSFAYTTKYSDGVTSFLGPAHLASMTDRRGNTATITYSVSPDVTQVTQGTEQSTFQSIDGTGRVGEVDAGAPTGQLCAPNASSNLCHETLYTWDTSSSSCRQPDAAIDNNLCQVVRKSLGAATPDENTTFLYNDEGQVLRQTTADSPANLVTTYGYHTQVVEAGQTTSCFDDKPAGSGNVTSAASPQNTAGCSNTPGPRAGDAGTVFVLSDRTASLRPDGNLAGASVSAYLTTLQVDDSAASTPNQGFSTAPTTTLCSGGAHNTGLLCESDAAPNGSVVTQYTYEYHGQRATMRTPKSYAKYGNTGPSYGYTYYPDPSQSTDSTQLEDLSGTTAQAGWLKTVTDPTNHFVAFAYDAAGNVVRTWDRNATSPYSPNSFPGTISAPPTTQYAETLYGPGTGATAYSQPWRYPTSQRDPANPTSARTVYTVDANGNVVTVQPPRGSQAGSTAYNITRTYDNNDNLTSEQMPFEADPANYSTPHPTTYDYDQYNNRDWTEDPNGNFTVYQHDNVNRLIQTSWSRGSSVGASVPSSCHVSSSADSPIPANKVVCLTGVTYDMVDNKIDVNDGAGAPTDFTFDAAHRQVSREVARDTSTNPMVMERTDTVYDANGNATDVCPPREFTEGSGSCTGTGIYSTHTAYDEADRVTTVTTYRATGTSYRTVYTYDADGNVLTRQDGNLNTTSMSYDLLDHRLSEVQPRTGSGSNAVTTEQDWLYDAAGNVLAVTRPGKQRASDGTGGALVVDGSSYPQSHPLILDGTNNDYTNITLQNGGWISASAYNGGTGGIVDITASGTVSICSTCGISVAGLGPNGAPATSSGNGGSGGGDGGGSGGQAGLLNGLVSVAGGGGGGGHAGSGAAGQNDPGAAGQTIGQGGPGGPSYGATDLTDTDTLLTAMGSGGGAGGALLNQTGGAGGNGGGFVRIDAQTINDQGTITTAGSAGSTVSVGAGGGGGSGGDVYLSAKSVTLATGSAITVSGGAGGSGGNGVNGGQGSTGRVRIDADSISGSGYTPASYGSTYTSQDSRITAYSYDADNRIVDTVTGATSTNAAAAGTATGANNVRTRVMYDVDGHVVARFEPRAFAGSTTSPDPLFMVRTDYDVDGRPVAQYLPRYDNSDDGGTYSDLGLSGYSSTQSQQCPTGATPQSIAGVPAFPSAAGVCVTKVTYDADGNRASLTGPAINSSSTSYFTYTYTDDRLPASVSAPDPSNPGSRLGTAQSNQYDGAGRLVETTDALGNQQLTSYYADGLVRSRTGQPNGTVTHVTQYAYDGNGNSTSVTDPAGNVSTSVYYPDNRLQYVQDAAGDRTTYTYDGVGNTKSVLSPSGYAKESTNPNGSATNYTYTQDNLVATVTTPFQSNGSTRRTTYLYDDGGRKVSQQVQVVSGTGTVLQDAGTQHFTYDDSDLVATESGRNGEMIRSSYDPAGELTSLSDSTSGVTLTSTYYVDDLVRSADDGQRTTQYSYDGSGSRTVRVDNVDGGNTRYATTYAYNPAGLPSTMSSTAVQQSVAGSTSWTYDKAGHPATETDPNSEKTSWIFNPDDTLQSQTLATSSGSTLAAWTYQYDQDYRISQQGFSGQPAASNGGSFVTDTFTYAYDSANRLKTFTNSGGTTTYGFDRDGNRTTVTPPAGQSVENFTFNADDSMASSPQSSAFTYTAAGDLSNDGCSTFAYDGLDRATAVTPISGRPTSCGSGTAVSYTYDGLDRQHSHTNGSAITAVHYDGGSSAIAIETSAGVDNLYELNPAGAAKAVTTESGSNPTQFLTSDGHGNITTATTSGQAVACSARFDPFGSPMGAAIGSSNVCNTGSTPNDIFYRGGRHDSSTGDYQFGGRTYDPSKAGFTTPDSYRANQPTKDLSVGTDPVTANRYNYVNGDPVNLADPNGHNPCRTEDPHACDPDQNRALAASDRGADISGSPHEPSMKNDTESEWLADIGAGGPRPRTYFSPPSNDTCNVQLYMQDGCANTPGPDYGGAHPETLTLDIPKKPGYGALFGDLFIPTDQSCLLGSVKCLRGDNRDFNSGFDPRQSRFFFYFDYDKGKATFVANPSCNGTSNDCNDALDITQSRWLSELHRNLIQVDDYDGGRIVVHTELSNSEISPLWMPPAIDNTWIIVPENNGGRKQFGIIGEGDQYPSAEFYHLNHGKVTVGGRYTAAMPWMLEGPAPNRDYEVDAF